MIKRAIVIVFIHNDNCEVLAIDFVLYLENSRLDKEFRLWIKCFGLAFKLGEKNDS